MMEEILSKLEMAAGNNSGSWQDGYYQAIADVREQIEINGA